MTPKVEITWIDSMTHSGWRDIEEAMEKSVANCKTVGYILRKDEDMIVLAMSWSENAEQVSDVTCIPSVAVEEIVELERVDGPSNS